LESLRSALGPEAKAALEGWSPEALAGLSPAREVQTLLESEGLGLRGEVDKIGEREGAEIPVLVRATEPPPSGAWRSDRAALAACSMLLEERRGGRVTRGVVEYVGSLPPAVREVRITGYDRNLVRALLDRVRRMGPRRPGRPWRAPCASCNFYTLCFPKGRRLL
jgi:CRISPR/Cas system-associated exonuclease Cas4 (RecB family)